MLIPNVFLEAIDQTSPSWRTPLKKALFEVNKENKNYLTELSKEFYLPTEKRIFSAFKKPLEDVRYVLIGESPYPREDSATGYCFMDGSVSNLWSVNGLSKKVNKATSLRNFLKMLLVTEGVLKKNNTNFQDLKKIAKILSSTDSVFIQKLSDLQYNLLINGFLLINTSLVFRKDVSVHKEAKYWLPFMKVVFETLINYHKHSLPTLILMGKVSEFIKLIPDFGRFPSVISEHPYNLSFIRNKKMHELFKGLSLLKKKN